MFVDKKNQEKSMALSGSDYTKPDYGKPSPSGQQATLLTIVGMQARMEGKFDIADSIQVECEIAGEMTVGGKLVIGGKGVVTANVQTVDAIIMGQYEGNMVATGNVEIAETGRVTGNIQTDSLVISRGGFFNGNVTKINGGQSRNILPIEDKLEERAAASQA